MAVKRIKVPDAAVNELENKLILVFSGLERLTNEVHGVTAKGFGNTDLIFDDMTSFKNTGASLRRLILGGTLRLLGKI